MLNQNGAPKYSKQTAAIHIATVAAESKTERLRSDASPAGTRRSAMSVEGLLRMVGI
jgi:hypothetical protein